MRIAVVDDHELLRMGVGRAIAAVPGWSLALSAGTADELVERGADDVDLVVLDFAMPGRLSGYDAVEAVIALGVEVVVLTASDPQEVAAGCLERGALAVVNKADGPTRLRDEIARHTGVAGDPIRLTPREYQVVAALQRGLQNQEIAAALSLSLSGVKRHLERVMEKTDVRTRSGLAALPLDAIDESRH